MILIKLDLTPPYTHQTQQVIFLCIDAVALLQAQGGDHHGSANGSSNGNSKTTDGSAASSSSSSSSSSSGPGGSASLVAASALGAMGLRDLLLLEVLWFALDMVRSETGQQIRLRGSGLALTPWILRLENPNQPTNAPDKRQALQFRTEVEVIVAEEDPATGEERERTLVLRESQAIALHYLQRDFWLDLLFSFPWRGLSALLLVARRKVR